MPSQGRIFADIEFCTRYSTVLNLLTKAKPGIGTQLMFGLQLRFIGEVPMRLSFGHAMQLFSPQCLSEDVHSAVSACELVRETFRLATENASSLWH